MIRKKQDIIPENTVEVTGSTIFNELDHSQINELDRDIIALRDTARKLYLDTQEKMIDEIDRVMRTGKSKTDI